MNQEHKNTSFTEEEILNELDLSFFQTPGKYFPESDQEDVKYNFFLDLEHGYFLTAGSKIHLYADDIRWAIVFEKNGYQNRDESAVIELNYIGNCITYNIEEYPDRKYITNSKVIPLIISEEFQRISDHNSYELIASDIKEIYIRNTKVTIEQNYEKYNELGINVRDYDNPNNQIGFGDLIRYINHTQPELISATEADIKTNLPHDLNKIMVINEFNFSSIYDTDNPPSVQETFILIAKILLEKAPGLWQPTLEANNHWSNWESGHL